MAGSRLSSRPQSEAASFWGRLLKEWARSGLSQAEFCRRRGLNAGTWAWWKRQLTGPARSPRATPRSRPIRSSREGRSQRPPLRPAIPFFEVPVPGDPTRSREQTPTPAYELVLAHDRVLRIPTPFDADTLGRLIAAVEAVC